MRRSRIGFVPTGQSFAGKLSMKARSLLINLFFAVVLLAPAANRAADYALRTSQNGFFRTVQYSADISALDGSFTIEFWFKAAGPGVLVNEVDAFNITAWDYSW